MAQHNLITLYNHGDGDDWFHIDTTDTVNGGTGIDTIMFERPNLTFDLVDFNLSDIENIQLDYTEALTLTLTLQDVVDSTDANNRLMIKGDGEDTVNSVGESWVQGSDQTIDGEIYHVYTSGSGTLLIDTDITQDIS